MFSVQVGLVSCVLLGMVGVARASPCPCVVVFETRLETTCGVSQSSHCVVVFETSLETTCGVAQACHCVVVFETSL